VDEERKARQMAMRRQEQEKKVTVSARVTLADLHKQIEAGEVKELRVILKGDVHGSVEALQDALERLSTDEIKVRVIHGVVGTITETDVMLASASNAIIIGFNVRPERKAQELAEQEKVDIRLHSIIYELQDEIKRAMTGLLEPTIKETYQGRALVKETFRIPKVGTIAGCSVTDGLIKRDSEVRLLRDNTVVFTGKVGSLRRFKDDASEVRNGMECGISIANYSDIKIGDVIEAFVTERIAAEVIA
jgi:translation initiation factor IF-2